MVLCAGCRVSVCSGAAKGEHGCLEYDDAMESEDFVYYCRFCNEGGSFADTDVCVSYPPYTLFSNTYQL